MNHRSALALPFALAALAGTLAVSGAVAPSTALAQDEGRPAPAKPKEPDAPAPEVKGNRFRLKLNRGSIIEGILPQGLHWEKQDVGGEYVDAAETEKGAGIRLQYVLNLDGDIFVQRADIAEIKDLGALTEEDKLQIQRQVLATRKKALEERERVLREEMAKMAAAGRAQLEQEGKSTEKKGTPAEKKAAMEAEEKKKGDALLVKFPPPDWGDKKLQEILRREVVNGIFRSEEEKEFIDNFKLWKDALDRKVKAEAEAAGGGDAGAGTDQGSGDKGSGDKGSGDTGGKKGSPPSPPETPPTKKKGGG